MLRFLKFLTEDKRGLNFYRGVLVVIAILLSPWVVISLTQPPVWLSILYLLGAFITYAAPFTLLYMGIYGSSYFSMLQQERFIIEHQSQIQSVTTTRFLLHQKAFEMKPYRFNYPAKIKPKVKEVEYRVIRINDMTVLLAYVFDLGTFKRYLKPLLLCESPNLILRIPGTKQVEVEIRIEDSRIHIIFLNEEYAIKKLVTVDSLSEVPPLEHHSDKAFV